MSRLILTLLLTSAAAMRFEDYEVTFNKKYSFGERLVRRAHFEQSLQRASRPTTPAGTRGELALISSLTSPTKNSRTAT